MFPTWLDIWFSVNAEPVSIGQIVIPLQTLNAEEMPLSAKTMPSSVPQANENLLGNQLQRKEVEAVLWFTLLSLRLWQAVSEIRWQSSLPEADITSLLKYSCAGGDMKRLGMN